MSMFCLQLLTRSSTPESSSSTASDPSQQLSQAEAAAHKNEGFLKSAWHKLTHQHDNLPGEGDPAESNAESKETPPSKEDKKAASSSG